MSKLHILPILSGSLISLGVIAGCARPQAGADHSDLPDDVRPAATAIIADSAPQFAATINYPLERPYPLPDIIDSAQMVSYYPIMVDDSLKSMVKDSPDSLWTELGWRGWTLDDGSYLWIDAGKVYQVNYVSKRENQLLDSLRREEIASLDPSLRTGWLPVLCIIDSVGGKIFRIDSDETSDPPQYRLAGYASGTDLSGVPTMILYGKLDVDGSMANRFYHFEDSIGTQADFSPDIISEEDTVPELYVVRHGKHKIYKVKPGYWLEQIRKASGNDSDPSEYSDSISIDESSNFTDSTDMSESLNQTDHVKTDSVH